VRARVAAEFGGWAASLRALITEGETPPVVRSLHTLPPEQRWKRVPGVTLVGDAAHLMPPSGEGANLAMLDGAELGLALAAHSRDPEAALHEYEQAMFPRSETEALQAHELQGVLYGESTPSGLIGMFMGARDTAHE
jgi:2-polyprenyl-6-methoxyphenol hydroxylase-like FAD-dependent oxidoreductase